MSSWGLGISKPLHTTFGVQCNLHMRRGSPIRVGWCDEMGWVYRTGYQKYPSYFLYTLWVYRSCMSIHIIYIVKSCHKPSYEFQNSMSSWGVGICFSKLQSLHFCLIMTKVRCLKNTQATTGIFFKIWCQVGEIGFTSPYTLPLGLSAIYTRVEWRAYGWDGITMYRKCPSIFFILCGYIVHVYVYLSPWE